MRQYLNLPEALLQAWLDQTVIFLVLATLKVFFFSRALMAMIAVLSETSLPLCRRLEVLAQQMKNAPEQMSKMTSLVLQMLVSNMHTLVTKMIYLLAMIAKSIIGLLIDLYLGTLTCLITALVKGTLELASDILSNITEFVQNAINAVLKEFNVALSGLSSVINGFTSAVSAVESLFSSSDKSKLSGGINKVNLTISSLKDISIPTTWIAEIEKLADEVPDFEDVLSNVTALVTFPISHIAERASNSSFNFTLNETFLLANSTGFLDLPETEGAMKRNAMLDPTLSVCDDVEKVFNEAISVSKTTADYIILGLCIGTILYAVVIWVFAYFRMRKRTRLYAAVAELTSPVDVGNSISQYEHGVMAILTRRWKTGTRWLYSYVTTPNLRTCLMLGIMGWLIVLLQFVVLQQASRILKRVLDDGVVSADSQSMLAAEFSDYLDEAQDSLDSSVGQINSVVFSSVQTTTSDMIDKIDLFQTSVNNTINTVFGSSFLAKPLHTIIYCTIGRKLDSIEKGLQWIEDNAEFSSPKLDKAQMERLFVNSTDGSSKVLQGFADHVYPAIQRMIKSQKKALWTEFFIATALVAVWVVYLLIGLAILARRRPEAVAAENRLSTQAISWPSQLRAEAQEEYTYPYNDPYGVPYAPKYDDQDSIISKPPSAYPPRNASRKQLLLQQIAETDQSSAQQPQKVRR